MKAMDFEEFLCSLGYSDNQIELLIDCFNDNKPIPENINNLFKDLFLKYVSIGDFPKVRKEYIKSKKIIEKGDIITIPHYMPFVLGKDLYDFQSVL